jgi:geranylgeranyl diphosphate synthase, type II
MLYEQRIEKGMKEAIEKMGEKSRLRDACEYALTSGGKRLRPILVLMIAEALGHGLDVLPVALGVEFFHTASLIADDLPCMDNDNFRRGIPSLHKQFGESVALLASYTLIAAGYGTIHENREILQKNHSFGSRANEAAVLCLEAATRCAGLQGATNGQFLDLYPPDQSLATLRKTMTQKTGTLFEIAFVFGWLFGGGDVKQLYTVRKAAHHLGLAFQMQDDLQDDAKTILSKMSFEEEMALLEVELRALNLYTEPFKMLLGRLCTC